MIKICHITSAHPRYDIRIFLKECKSLANAGYDVTLLCTDNKPNEIKDGVSIISVDFHAKNRFHRILHAKKILLRAALNINADIYHFHDPELLSLGSALRSRGKKVIYDTHEDVPRQLLTRAWIPLFLRKIVSFLFEKFENYHAKRFNYIIAATPHIAERFITVNTQTVAVNNYPLKSEIVRSAAWVQKKPQCCYIGGIGVIRGIYPLMDALTIAKVPLQMCGDFDTLELKKQVSAMPGFDHVVYHGLLPRQQSHDVVNMCKIGIVTYLPEENHIASQPNKLFEYMAAGIPVIASHFPLWRCIVEENHCGICVDPENPREIAEAIRVILANDDQARTMGENGRKAVEEKYNWSAQEQIMLSVYERL